MDSTYQEIAEEQRKKRQEVKIFIQQQTPNRHTHTEGGPGSFKFYYFGVKVKQNRKMQ